jgi:hypothetical protein
LLFTPIELFFMHYQHSISTISKDICLITFYDLFILFIKYKQTIKV